MISLVGRRTGPPLTTPAQLPDKVFIAPQGLSWSIYALYGEEVLTHQGLSLEDATDFAVEVLHTPKELLS